MTKTERHKLTLVVRCRSRDTGAILLVVVIMCGMSGSLGNADEAHFDI